MGQVEGSTNETHHLVGVSRAIPYGGFSFAVLCVGERFVFPFLFKLNYRFGIAAVGFMLCQKAGDEILDSQAEAMPSANLKGTSV